MKKSIFLVTRTNWTELPRIRHEIAQELSKFYHVFFIEAPSEICTDKKVVISEIEKNLMRVIVPKLFKMPNAIKRYELVFGILNNIYAAYQIIKFSRKIDHPIVLINFNYDFYNLMSTDAFKGKIYFCNDDFVASMKSSFTRAIVRHAESQTAKKADVCLCNHLPIVKRLKSYNENSHLFLQAHNFSISKPRDIPKRKIDRFTRIKAAYMGFIDERLDYKILHDLAKQPDIKLHMIGPFSSEVISPIYRKGICKNGIFYGSVEGNDLEKLLKTMDVLLIPFKEKIFMASATSTNKIFKYIAAGKPVVITGMPHFMSFPEGVVYKARCDSSFVDTVRQAYMADCKPFQLCRSKIAHTHSWTKRIEQLKLIIDDFFNEN